MTANDLFGIVCGLIGLPLVLWIMWQVLRGMAGAIGWLIESSGDGEADEQRVLRRRAIAADRRIRQRALHTRAAMEEVALRARLHEQGAGRQNRLP